MKKVLMMILEDCPYCHQAFRMMEELKKEHPEYEQVEIRVADEEKEKELADSLDYYYVPTYFVDGVKLHEGVPTREKVQAVYEAALRTENE
ncbi:MAG: thioredoxin family protein [Candidatus Limivivens sp.]|nr:thioredoxin family protein [Candidatus Limivivens sp.]